MPGKSQNNDLLIPDKDFARYLICTYFENGQELIDYCKEVAETKNKTTHKNIDTETRDLFLFLKEITEHGASFPEYENEIEIVEGTEKINNQLMLIHKYSIANKNIDIFSRDLEKSLIEKERLELRYKAEKKKAVGYWLQEKGLIEQIPNALEKIDRQKTRLQRAIKMHPKSSEIHGAYEVTSSIVKIAYNNGTPTVARVAKTSGLDPSLDLNSGNPDHLLIARRQIITNIKGNPDKAKKLVRYGMCCSLKDFLTGISCMDEPQVTYLTGLEELEKRRQQLSNFAFPKTF